ncbi:MAG: biopolymer transporter ExbD [Candidatus Omnitrophica bacterium]|nr:biopolymer transporter ExbD [Candidatus Omnitrophota bacterium]MDE2009406.1 biopolymer transporter ExbD [Candidatus Omnitrophota bacterium]MDE2214190.1 biopolymer transporter ExbD [Candidatus Omnitrophota bacterium]MDE2231227.1 biopolymer transporter ExbD [Candidatus Omnitrophota bacterium]
MSLERFEIRKDIFHPVLAVAFINFTLTMIVLIMSATVLARPSGFEMEFPSFREYLGSRGTVITITSENVIYVDGHVVTLNELRHFLAQEGPRGHVLTIKAAGRASMGRVADILNLCRGLSGARVNVSTVP